MKHAQKASLHGDKSSFCFIEAVRQCLTCMLVTQSILPTNVDL